MTNIVKEPLIHITKRAPMPMGKKALIRVIAFLSAFILCGILALVLIPKLRDNPARIGEFYLSFINGNFENLNIFWVALKDLAILLCISLAVTPAFRMKFWNTGAEGQALVGTLAAAGISYNLGGKLDEWLLVLLMLVGALLAGAVWGVIPALFKAQWNTNETLFTLMMNYVATFLVGYFISKWVTDGSMVMPSPSAGFLPTMFGNQYLLTILLVLLLTLFMFVYLNYSKHGYEISVVGESVNTAKYIGIDVKKVIIRTMILSGALCGFVGFLLTAGLHNAVNDSSIGGQGFTAIMVSWLAKFSPLYMFLTSGIIVFLNRGASRISTNFDVTGSLSNIFVGLTLLFIIGSEFFINYEIHFRKKAIEVEPEQPTKTKEAQV